MSKQNVKSKKHTRPFLPTFFITLFALSALGGLYFIMQGDNLISGVFPFSNWGNNQNVSSKSSQQNGFSRQTLRRAYPMPHPAAFAFENSIVVLCGLRQFPPAQVFGKTAKNTHFFMPNIYHIIYATRLFICLIS